VPHPKVKISDNSGNTVNVSDIGGTKALDVNILGATIDAGDLEINSEFPAAAAITDDFANPETTSVMSMGMGYEGSTWDRLTSTSGKLNVNTGNVTVIQNDAARTVTGTVGHNITGMVSGDNNTISDSTAEQLDGSTSGLDVACKRVDMMADPDNTGYIWVGDSGVAGNGSGGGIKLAAGDFYSIDVNNLNDIWVIATTDTNPNIYYNYFT